MKAKTRKFLEFLMARLSEPSTWQGLGFLVSMFTSRFAGLDWAQAVGIGSTVSAAIKMFVPDKK